MKLSIIVVNWNTKEVTLECIRSIYKHKPNFSFEVIVVDNGSTDDSVKEFDKLKYLFKNLQIVKNKDNLGFAKANNIGITRSLGKYKLLLNSDTIVTDKAFDELIKFADNKADAGLVGARLLNKDGSVQESVFKLPTVGRVIKQYWLNQKGLLDKYAPNTDEFVEVEAMVAAALLITPIALKKAGLMNSSYFMYFEDLDYCRKVKNKGLKVYYLSRAKIIHLHGVSGRKISSDEEQWKRLIPGSKIYHGILKHYLIFIIMWSAQKLKGFR